MRIHAEVRFAAQNGAMGRCRYRLPVSCHTASTTVGGEADGKGTRVMKAGLFGSSLAAGFVQDKPARWR